MFFLLAGVSTASHGSGTEKPRCYKVAYKKQRISVAILKPSSFCFGVCPSASREFDPADQVESGQRYRPDLGQK